LPSNATQKAPQTECAIIDNDDAPPHLISVVHLGRPTIFDINDNAPPTVRCPRTQAQLCTQAEFHLINMVIKDNLIPNFSLNIKPHTLHHSYLQAAQALAV
jgi:hypothetical protein